MGNLAKKKKVPVSNTERELTGSNETNKIRDT